MLDRKWQPQTRPLYLASQARSLGDLFLRRVDSEGSRLAFQVKRSRDPDSGKDAARQGDAAPARWIRYTWGDFYDRAAGVAGFLIRRGIAPGDKVCIVGATGPEWCFADIGGHLAGAVTLGAYPTLASDQLAYILDHSDSRIAFVQGAAEVAKILPLRDRLGKLEAVCVWDVSGLAEILARNEWLITFDEATRTLLSRSDIDARVAAVDRHDTAIIVYTSGTTGPPKGAMLSHHNILTCLPHYADVFPLDRHDHGFNFLPMAHVAERIAGFYGRLASGLATSFATSTATVLGELEEIRPTVFGSVPRIFEKAYDRIMSQVEGAPPARRRVFRWAEAVGRAVVQRWQAGQPVPVSLRLQHRLADRLVFSRIRQVFGGNVRQFLTGAAPISPAILEFFWAAGFPIYEVYGLTEATVISHGNRPGAVRLGSVGQAMPVVEERIAEDGEVLLRGPAVFQGYYKDAEATAAAIDSDGWLHTGDIGEHDRDGYLYIRDRKKHIIITAGGKNLTPANIENEVKASDALISQVHVHGDRRPYLTALVTLGAAEAIAYARSRGKVADADAARLLDELARNPLKRSTEMLEIGKALVGDGELARRMAAAVRSANQRLARVETIKKIYLLDREFSVEEDEMTPTLKLKRKAIESKFAAVFDRLYSEASFGVEVERNNEVERSTEA